MTNAISSLELDQVSIWLGGKQILSEVSFAIAPGEFTGLIGTNGAGKTTVFRAILGQIRPSGGKVIIAGRDRSKGDTSVGYVPQKVQIDPDVPLRARDLVALGLDGNTLGLSRRSVADKELIEETLEAVGAETIANRRVGTLSGGELQRVLIGHAIISRPQILLLDEPLANLDIKSEHEIVDLLSTITTDQNLSILISAHDMNSLLPFMDRVIYLAGGRCASGTAEQVIRTEVLSELYGFRVSVIHVDGRVVILADPPPMQAKNKVT